ncbi:MAG TPA: tetratricopeptide repeat protein [Longimicrobiales bacterium]|nr:tetratricopeptide repeat protein [Longimicrobiales bacterium]
MNAPAAMDRTLRNRLCSAGVAAAALLVYANSLANRFAYDDLSIIKTNARVHDLRALGDILLTPYWPFFGRQFGLYRPLAILAYAVQWALGGGAPWVFHVGNVLEHAAVCVLVYLFLERLTSWRAALAGALVFAVHPVHTEAVANVVGQAELLGALGILAGALLYVSRPDLELTPRRRWAIAAAFALAVGTKESTIVFPALLPVLDLAQGRLALRRGELARYARALAPTALVLGVIGGGYILLRVAVLGTLTASDANPSLRFLQEHHVLMGLRVWPEYLRLLLFPSDLSADYSPAVILPVTAMDAETWLGLALLVITVGCALLVRRHPGIGLPAAWFLVTILIVSNLFFPIGVVLAERTLYLPSIALALGVAYVWDALPDAALRPALAWGALGLVVALGGLRTMVRNPDWKSTQQVWYSVVRDHPESFRGQWYAGDTEESAGHMAAARDHWTLAYRLWPEGGPGFWESMAGFLYRTGRFAEAASLYEHTIRAFGLGNAPAGDHEMLVLSYLGATRYSDALRAAERAMRQYGPTPPLADLRAHALTALDSAGAIPAWHAVIRADTLHGAAEQWAELARAFVHAGLMDSARAALDTAQLRAGSEPNARAQVDGYRRAFFATGAPRPVEGFYHVQP